jgi:hypothetical protein
MARIREVVNQFAKPPAEGIAEFLNNAVGYVKISMTHDVLLFRMKKRMADEETLNFCIGHPCV